ncbi:hypothetical protein JCM17960_21660 [Magnetospira thiophila]
MTEIINLRQARKQKARAEKEDKAAANRVRFGRTKGQKKADSLDRLKASRNLDGKQRET